MNIFTVDSIATMTADECTALLYRIYRSNPELVPHLKNRLAQLTPPARTIGITTTARFLSKPKR